MHDHRFNPTDRTWQTTLNDVAMCVVGRLSGLLAGLGSRAGDALGILTYHRIAPRIPGLPFPLHNVTPQRFRDQIEGLLLRGYTPWPLRRVLQYRDTGRRIPPRTFVVTFDDGFENLFTAAYPVLQELNVPATVFLNTAYLGSTDPFPFDAWGVAWQGKAPCETYRPLSIEQCDAMRASGLVELGAHTHTHQDFRGRANAFRRDLQLSVDLVRLLFAQREVSFAFPFGSPHLGFAGGELEAEARKCGVVCALSQKPALVDPASDPFRWGRFNVFPWDTAATLDAKLAGWYGWAPALKKHIARIVGRMPQAAAARSVSQCLSARSQ